MFQLDLNNIIIIFMRIKLFSDPVCPTNGCIVIQPTTNITEQLDPHTIGERGYGFSFKLLPNRTDWNPALNACFVIRSQIISQLLDQQKNNPQPGPSATHCHILSSLKFRFAGMNAIINHWSVRTVFFVSSYNLWHWNNCFLSFYWLRMRLDC